MTFVGYEQEFFDKNLSVLVELFDDGTRSFTNMYEWQTEAPE